LPTAGFNTMQIPGYQIERELGQGGMAIVYLALPP
jgi:serine/threonine protein kinase